METLDKNPRKMMTGPELEDVTIGQVLYALSDVNRLKIVQMIDAAGGELRCGSFSDEIGLTKPTLSHHFGILRESGVIATRIDGTHKLNTIRRKELNRRFPGLLESILKSLKKEL